MTRTQAAIDADLKVYITSGIQLNWEKRLGIFGASRKEKFVLSDAFNLANYLRNNAVKAGGEAYAKCQAAGILAKEIDEPLLWYFWSIVYGYRVAQDVLELENSVDHKTRGTLITACIQISNHYLRPMAHEPYVETHKSMEVAAEIIRAKSGKSSFDQASAFMLHAVNDVAGVLSEDQKFAVVLMLTEAATSFPSLKTIIDQNA